MHYNYGENIQFISYVVVTPDRIRCDLDYRFQLLQISNFIKFHYYTFQ